MRIRTTLSIDEDLLAIAREMAARQNVSLGEIVSSLIRKGLNSADGARETRNGVLLLPRRTDGRKITLEFVNALRDEEP